MKSLVKTLAIVLLGFNLLGTSFFVCQAAGDNFATESLNNIVVEGVSAQKKVSSSDATTTLRVTMTNQGETAKLYKLASVEYNSSTKAYGDPQWDSKITNWLKAQSSYSRDGAIISAYKTPTSLGAASSSTWDQFYYDLLSSRSAINILEHGYNSQGEENSDFILTASAEKVVADDATNLNLDFTGTTIGIYAVIATAGESMKTYNPVVVEVIPQLQGPGTNYYIPEVVSTKLKAAEATIDKKINDKDSDSVHYGEQVRFNVDFTLPTVYKDRVTLNSLGDKAYKLQIEDTMSKAFDLLETPDFKLKYYFGKKGEDGYEEHTVSKDNVSYYAIADSTYVPATGETLIELTDENFSDYVYDLDDLEDLGSGTFYAVQKSAALYSVDYSEEKNAQGQTEIVMYLNMSVLKAMIAAQAAEPGMERSASSIGNATFSLVYSATVNDKIEIASENNTNTATIYYENNNVSDTARAYTYGVKVVKIDGATIDDELVSYLPNAHFNLYKEVATYLDSTPELTSDLFVFAKAVDDTIVEDPYSEEDGYAGVKSDFEEKGVDSRYYVIETSYTTAGTTDLGVEYAANQKVGRVFELCETGFVDGATDAFDGTIVSVASQDGITVKGLDEGNYVLMETAAPKGYNELAEDILFSIVRIDDETAKLQHNGSLSSFLDMDGELIESGIITLDVLNYKGLTLPSTGGKGIMMFTFLGMGLMMIAMTLIIVRNRTKDASYYM